MTDSNQFSIYKSNVTGTLAIKETRALYDCEEISRVNAENITEAFFNSDMIKEHLEKGFVPVLLIEPTEVPSICLVENNLDNFDLLLGYERDSLDLPEDSDVRAFYAKNGKDYRLTLNRAITWEGALCDIVAGNMFVASSKSNIDNGIVSLDKDSMQRTYEDFYNPQMFVFKTESHKISVIQCTYKIGKVLKENNMGNLSVL